MTYQLPLVMLKYYRSPTVHPALKTSTHLQNPPTSSTQSKTFQQHPKPTIPPYLKPPNGLVQAFGMMFAIFTMENKWKHIQKKK